MKTNTSVILSLSILFSVLILSTVQAQTATFVPPGNTNYVGLEKNLLFNATTRYQVNQTGTRSFSLPMLFDGIHMPFYLTGFDGTNANAVSIEISGSPEAHVQLGAQVGFTSRYLPARKFKIEGYDTYNGRNVWKTLANVSNNDDVSRHVSFLVQDGSFTKLRYTFYDGQQSTGDYAGWIGVSELFFLHGEQRRRTMG